MFVYEFIKKLEEFWISKGVVTIPTFEKEAGAGTFHPHCFYNVLKNKPFSFSYVAPSRRQADGRYGESPNRVFRHHQFQVIISPNPENIKELAIESLEYVGLDLSKNDVRFICNDWESPTLGAFGVGWEVWINGMEMMQFTYFQKFADKELELIPVELAYGIERSCLCIFGEKSFFDLEWGKNLSYGDLFLEMEKNHSKYLLEICEISISDFQNKKKEIDLLIKENLFWVAYESFLDLNVIFNKLDARKKIAQGERKELIETIRTCAKEIGNLVL